MNLNRFALWRYGRIYTLVMLAILVVDLARLAVTRDSDYGIYALTVVTFLVCAWQIQLLTEERNAYRRLATRAVAACIDNDIAHVFIEKESK